MRLSAAVALCCLCTLSFAADPAHASIRKDTNIPAEGLGTALETLAKDYDFQVLYRTEIVKDRKTQGAVGALTSDEALTKVLSGTGLSYKYLDASTVTIVPVAMLATGARTDQAQTSPNNAQDNSKEAGKKSSQDFRLAQATAGQAQGDVSVEKLKEEPKQKAVIEEIVVTGSRIPRATTEGAQEVKVYTKQQIEQSGQTNVADFLNSLPEVSLSTQPNGFQSFLGGTTVQLHGLPQGTTLVLINGRRVEVSGAQAFAGYNFFDLNTIPLVVIDRIEVMPEGSSAIYGSDAIAGVVNIILRRSFDGIEVSAKYGFADGTNETDATFALGKTWEKGAITLATTYQTNSELEGAERPLTSTMNYQAYGGADNRDYFCSPGNVFSVNGSNLPGVGATGAAVPAGYTGAPSQAEFAATAGQFNRCSNSAQNSVIPPMHRVGLLAEGYYSVTPSIELYTETLLSYVMDNFYSADTGLFAQPGFSQFTVSASNPYNPFGTTVGVGELLPSLGRSAAPLDSTFIRPLVGVRGDLFGSWHWDLSAWDAEDRSTSTFTNTLNNVAVQNALNSPIPSSALNPFIDGPPGSPALLQSLVFEQRARYFSRTLAVSGFMRGPLVPLPSGPVELAIGAEYDHDTLHDDQINNPLYPPNALATYHRDRHAFFGEARVPIVRNHGHMLAGDVLVATLAARYDDYSDFGHKTTPQFGVEWRPVETLLLRGAYSRAFKAPSLYDLYQPQTLIPGAQIVDPLLGNQQEVVSYVTGGNPRLKPEVGLSRTLGVVYSSKLIPDFQIFVTYWSIDETNSIQSLAPQVIVSSESAFPGDVVRASSCPGGPPCPITQINSTLVNFGTLSLAGFDYQLKYKYASQFGEWVSAVNATQTYRYSQALTPNSSAVDATGIANDNGDWAPRWKGTVTLGWNQGPYALNMTGRYIGRYQDYDRTQQIGNFWLYDLNMRYAIGQAMGPDKTWLKGAYVELGGVNLLNRLPQWSNYFFGFVGYDPAESDIRGRFLYARLGTKW